MQALEKTSLTKGENRSKNFDIDTNSDGNNNGSDNNSNITNNINSSTTNKSPPKQTFSTIKNFLRNKSSLTDLKVWQDFKREEFGKELRNGNPASLKHEKSLEKLRQSKSATKLSDVRNRVPRKKRSLGSLLPPPRNETKEPSSKKHEQAEQTDSKEETFVLPPIPRQRIFLNTPSASSGGMIQTAQPTTVTFTLDPNEPKVPSTPTLNSTIHSDLYSTPKNWAPPTTICGTYVHDWSGNASPRSLTESLKVGKVDPLVPNINIFSSPANIEIDKVCNDVVANPNNQTPEEPLRNSELSSQSDSQLSKANLKINLQELVEPSNPFPSPCTINNSFAISDDTLRDKESSTFSNEINKSLNSSLSHLHSSSDELSVNSNHSRGSNGSQTSEFSFMRNRTSSISFYKSNEQVERERDMSSERLERLKMKEFLGTAQEVESELIEGLSSNSRKIVDAFDEDVNYIDFEEDDDTDALFNRDLFGIRDEAKTSLDNMNTESISYDEDVYRRERNLKSCENMSPSTILQQNTDFSGSEDEYNYNTPQGLELSDDEYENDAQTKLVSNDNVYNYKFAKRMELSDDEYEYQPATRLELSDDEYEYQPTTGLELSDNEYEYRPPTQLEIKDEECEYRSPAELESRHDGDEYRNSRHKGLSDNEYNYKPRGGLELSDDEYQEKNSGGISSHGKNVLSSGSNDGGESNVRIETLENDKIKMKNAEASSRAILDMLNGNNSNLSFRPNSPDITIKHMPSAKLQRHRSLKFHHLSGDIENEYYKDTIERLNSNKKKNGGKTDNARIIWENESAIDEVNQIPEDYEFENTYTSGTECLKNVKSNRFSTMVAPSSNDYDSEINEQVASGNKQHLWKKLINVNKHPIVERIQLDNRTITLFNCSSNHSIQDGVGETADATKQVNHDETISTDSGDKKAELSIIME